MRATELSVLYTAPDIESVSNPELAVHAALEVTAELYEVAWRLAQELPQRYVQFDSPDALFVALKPDSDSIDARSVLAVGLMTGEQTSQRPLATFLLKAAQRAFRQRTLGFMNDYASPLEALADVPDQALYLGCGASLSGLHVGAAGPWPHHTRLLADSFVESLAFGLNLPRQNGGQKRSLVPYDEAIYSAKRAWYKQVFVPKEHGGVDAGDNGTKQDQARRDRFDFMFDRLALALLGLKAQDSQINNSHNSTKRVYYTVYGAGFISKVPFEVSR